MGYRIAIDRGGTFTDCVGNPGTGCFEDDVIIKLLSVDPRNYPDAPLEGIRRLLEIFTGKQIPRGLPLDTSNIESIRMGTTVATNALLERKGERCALITTKGFKDCLVIGNQTRPRIFDLSIKRPDVLYETVVEVDERVTLEDYTEDPRHSETETNDVNLVRGLSGEVVRILKKPDQASIKSTLTILHAMGIRSVAICLLHSYTFPEHERLIGRIAKEIGFTHISLSSDLSPMIKFIPRANSSIADAYLTPEIKKYLNGFENGLLGGLDAVRCEFMQSDGGLVDATKFSGFKAILSGPAGGVVGYAATCYDKKNAIPLIGFDMGGTSTDVSRFGDGKFEHVFETTTAGVTIQTPQLDINTVAAGGGSQLFWRNGLFVVGPESASSHPGPACYRKNGPLTITDANLMLGRLVPEFFPKIFGANEDQSLDEEATKQKFEELTKQINEDINSQMSIQDVAYGFIKVANETMARPIRALTESRGFLTSNHRLVSFGGAGGQHAVAVAESLGISSVLVHRYSSVLSAYGMSLADVVEEIQQPCSRVFNGDSREFLEDTFDNLTLTATKRLAAHGFEKSSIRIERFLNLRYKGTESAIMVSSDSWDFLPKFLELHQREFGFTFENTDLLVDDIRIRGIGLSSTKNDLESVDEQKAKADIKDVDLSAAKFIKKVYFEDGNHDTGVFRLEDLSIGSRVNGPAILADGTQTNIIPPHASALILRSHVVISIKKNSKKASSRDLKDVDPVMLSIFGHRFMDIAEQMGTALQKTSVSTNVKERLDFSCALFDPDGNLVANAPHLPVHLGSMSLCVSSQAKLWAGKLKPGDVMVSNHPAIGGTHLPDITVITPAFSNGKIIFYVASRAHHADIGGILPGSMPPNSHNLFEEGAEIYSELLVSKGRFCEKMIEDILLNSPAKHPGCSGTRRLSDNISDLKAQVAANQKGITLISSLLEEFGEDTVISYMTAIQDNAAITVEKMLQKVRGSLTSNVLVAEDYMDDGSKIKLRVEINSHETVFDFTGTSPQVYGNINAPEAVTYSALIYCLRCLVKEEIPLNQGCLRPVKVIIEKGSFLSPSKDAAVVGGNVLTSQRVTDVILKAFNAMAASQGDCNNLTFGTGGNDSTGSYTEGFGYYETIAGGHGAGPSWDGVSGVHTNMTNTRITDVEIFERRYPVILHEFSIRQNSGGRGKHTGGNGVIRDIEFRIPVQVSILSERRVHQPYGLEGGEAGELGLNLWIRHIKDSEGKVIEQRKVNIGGKSTVCVEPDDHVIIQTPGGGGYGRADDSKSKLVSVTTHPKDAWIGGSIANRCKAQESN